MKFIPDLRRISKWPEFQAFAARLGIVEVERRRRIRITIELGSFPLIETEYIGTDTETNCESPNDTGTD